ncbi:MAG: ABC transporter ATP-binding protein [Saprospiraceae bacterium]
MIEVRHLTKQFGNRTALHDLSFKLEAGQTLALIGSSGSGKTTTLRMINRLIEPDAGQILVNEEDVTHQPLEQMRRRMGYVIQNTGLFPHYTVAENIAIVPNLLQWSPARIRTRVQELLEQMGLPPAEYATKYPDQLSGGQQQRVGLARALAADPPIILMDEPFGALDPITRMHIRQEVLALEEFQDKTIIIVTHDAEEAFAMADMICLLHEGVVQQLDTPQALLRQPANDFVRDFFARQQLQLEWAVFTLEDVFAQLPSQSPGNPEFPIPIETTIRETIYLLNKNPEKAARVAFHDINRYFDLPILLKALQNIK